MYAYFGPKKVNIHFVSNIENENIGDLTSYYGCKIVLPKMIS